MPFNVHNAADLEDFQSGGNKGKSTFRQRLDTLGDLLAANDAINQAPDAVADYAQVRNDLADEFVSRFKMLPDGARKVSGDTISNGLHGLQLRKVDKSGASVVPLKLAGERVKKASEIVAQLPTSTKDKDVLAAVLRGLGLPTPADRKKAKEEAEAAQKDQEKNDADTNQDNKTKEEE